MAKILLYQFDYCPYCKKVRDFMDEHAIAYDIEEVDRNNKPEEVTSTGGTVPVIKVDGEVISDSSRIIAWLEKHILNN